jgi:flagellar basal-body rod protein FlgB
MRMAAAGTIGTPDFNGGRALNEIADSSIMSALGRQMTRAVAKQLVAAGNLANIDTPGYRTRTVSFDDVLDQQLQMPLKPAASGRSAAATLPGNAPAAVEADGLPMRRDGNNVQLDRELLDMTKASADFSAAQAALAAKFRLIRYAINEGK